MPFPLKKLPIYTHVFLNFFFFFRLKFSIFTASSKTIFFEFSILYFFFKALCKKINLRFCISLNFFKNKYKNFENPLISWCNSNIIFFFLTEAINANKILLEIIIDSLSKSFSKILSENKNLNNKFNFKKLLNIEMILNLYLIS